MQRTEIRDDDGHTHLVHLRQRDGKYYACERYSTEGMNITSNYDTPEQAIEKMKRDYINANCAKRFDDLSPEQQEKIVSYINKNFSAGVRGNSYLYSSYYLKHVVERGIHEYVSNGQLKGAMKKAGFSQHNSTAPADINYNYALKGLTEDLT